MATEQREFGQLGLKKESNLPKDVICINKHGRKVGVSYKFYIQHGRFNGLTLAEDITVAKETEVADVVKVNRIAEVKKIERESKDPKEKTKETANKEEAVFICEVCGKVAKSKAGLTTHLKTHETKDKIPKKK